jgi:hypothetical protein
MFIYDGDGKPLTDFAIKPDQSLYALRGDDMWMTGRDGTVRHFHQRDLVASMPILASEIRYIALGRGVLATVGSDASLILVDANAKQIVDDPDLCKRIAFGSNGIATGYQCGETMLFYMGRRHLGDYPMTSSPMDVAYEPASGRSAVAADRGVRVFDKDAKQIASSDKYGGIAFADAEHLWVITVHDQLSRWAFLTDTWETIGSVPQGVTIGAVPGAVLLGTAEGVVRVLYPDGRERTHFDVGAPVNGFSSSDDHRWVAVQLANGAAALVDAQAWTVQRTLAPGDANGDFPVFDPKGDLLLRANHYSLTIWDPASGEELVSGLDLLADIGGGRFLPDGRLEINSRRPSLLDIPRDDRPIADILTDIACHVPLKVVGSRIEPSVPIACVSGVSAGTLPR